MIMGVLGSIACVVVMIVLAAMHLGDDRVKSRAVASGSIDSSDAGIEPAPVGAPPKVEPVELLAIGQNDARRANAQKPFVTLGMPALPYRFLGDAQDRERAVTCLAAAAYYEAGNDAVGQQGVIQVVLNRARHPAFPSSVCGVVFQGAQRKTGCQFTFTCDGALRRTPVPAVWNLARTLAISALNGAVQPAVGLATHYHTDWVLPKWSLEMDKIAQLDTHIFFRWRGSWGRRGAFRQEGRGPEVIDPRIAGMAMPVSAVPEPDAKPLLPYIAMPLEPKAVASPIAAADLGKNVLKASDLDYNSFVLVLDADAYPGSYAVTAWKLCRDRAPCRVAGYRDASAAPKTTPLPRGWKEGLSFLYEKSGAGGQVVRWNCKETPRNDASQCL